MTQHQNAQTADANATAVYPALPKDTNAALRDVMKTIKNLEHVYEEENKALNNTDGKKFLSLQDKKIQAARHYQQNMEEMLARKNELKKADPATKEKLKALYAHFAETSQKNMQAIERMQRCTERLGNTIRSAAIKSAQKQRAYSYGETGAINGTAQRKAVSSGLSETV